MSDVGRELEGCEGSETEDYGGDGEERMDYVRE